MLLQKMCTENDIDKTFDVAVCLYLFIEMSCLILLLPTNVVHRGSVSKHLLEKISVKSIVKRGSKVHI